MIANCKSLPEILVNAAPNIFTDVLDASMPGLAVQLTVNLPLITFVVLTADPDPATYLSGTSVFAFPDELLEFTGLTWYGAFSDMSTGDFGPVAGSGAIESTFIAVARNVS